MMKLSKIEQTIMELLWERNQWMSGAEFWRYFNSHGKPCERSTVNTYLSRMAEKGLLVKNNRKYIYAYNKKEFDRKRAEHILEDAYDGSLQKFLMALKGSEKISAEDVEELKEYLEKLE